MKYAEKISVIVPAYNVAPWLGECIESILSQSYDNLEVIIVNDGSTDETRSVAETFSAKDSRVTVVNRQNGGLSAARNSGIEIATGKWICFVDSDDILPEFAIETLYNNAGDAPISSGNLLKFSNKIPKATRRNHPKKITGREAAEEVLFRQDRGVSASASGKLYRRSLWDSYRCTEGILYEDLDLIPKVLASVDKVAVTKDVVYLYRQHPASILGHWSPKRLDVLDVTQRLADDLADDPMLGPAASDRLVSAACNMLIEMRRAKYNDPAAKARCKEIIRSRRASSIASSKVRLRNRIALILSYLFIP